MHHQLSSFQWNQCLQVIQDEVAFYSRYDERELESRVTSEHYPPAIRYAVRYSRPLNYEQPRLDLLKVNMTGTNKSQVSFPITLYNAKGECVFVALY